MCKIQKESTASQNLSITLQVDEGEVVGRYSIEGTAQVSGFSFVVRTFSPGSLKTFCPLVLKARRLSSPQEPNITDIIPDYGPVFGGTTVTLTGRHLDSGLRRDVFIGEEKCHIQR